MRYASELLVCHKDFVQALQKFESDRRVQQSFVLQTETKQRVIALCMHYLHGYFAQYPPKAARRPLRRGLLLVSILALSFKVVFQDYMLEFFTIRE